MNKKKFSNLDLFTIRYPLTAIASLLHRISGVFVFLLIPLLLWLLDRASGSLEGFQQIQSVVTSPVPKLILWLVLSALWYHLAAGIRHLLMDIGFGEHLRSARVSAGITMLVGFLGSLLIGIWLW